jgi:hypothetical protein
MIRGTIPKTNSLKAWRPAPSHFNPHLELWMPKMEANGRRHSLQNDWGTMNLEFGHPELPCPISKHRMQQFLAQLHVRMTWWHASSSVSKHKWHPLDDDISAKQAWKFFKKSLKYSMVTIPCWLTLRVSVCTRCTHELYKSSPDCESCKILLNSSSAGDLQPVFLGTITKCTLACWPSRPALPTNWMQLSAL